MRRPPHPSIATGVSTDYWNEYFALNAHYYGIDGVKGVAELLHRRPVKRYEDRFPSDTYSRVVTEKNRTPVARLNRLAAYANSNFTDPEKFDDEKFGRLLHLAHRLVYGC